MKTAPLLVVLAALGGAAAPAAPAAGGGPADGGVSVHRGLLRAEAEIHLRALIPGMVTAVPRREGDPVAKGEPVVQLADTEPALLVALARNDLETAELGMKKVKDGPRPEDLERAEALYEEARAGLALAEKTLEADAKLHGKGVLSDLGMQRSERSLEAARANAESRRLDLEILRKGTRPEDIRLVEVEVERCRTHLAQRELAVARTRIAAPREGRGFVVRVHAEVGEWIEAGRVVAELVYMDRVRVDLDLAAAEGLRVRPGTPAVIRSPVFPGVELEARVARVSPVVDAASGTVRVVVEADNPDLRMRPGVEAEVEIRP